MAEDNNDAYVNMDEVTGSHSKNPSGQMEYAGEKPKSKRKMLFIVPCILIAVGVIVAVILLSSSSSSSDQDFCTQCVNDADCNSCLGQSRDTSLPRASCKKAAETDNTGQCECMNDLDNGLGYFGLVQLDGCQNLNSLPQRAALFEFYDAMGGDNWERSTGNTRITSSQPWFIEEEDDLGVGTGVMVENNVQSYCAFEYVLCTDVDQDGLREVSELWGVTDECFLNTPEVVPNEGCDGVGLTGSIPESIKDLTALTRLRLENPQDSNIGSNRISGALPPGIAELAELVQLDVSRNLMTGNLPDAIGNLTKLSRLGISNNRIDEPNLSPPKQSVGFTGEIPESIGDLTLLTVLDLSSNSFTGNIPPSIGNMTNLVTVNLARNQLEGPIPSQVRFLQNAQIFAVDQNNLDGPLETLQGGENGTLDCPICEMTALQTLALGPVSGFGPGVRVSNAFSGSIPTKINQLVDLAVLALNDNRFTGCIPATIAELNEPAGTRPDGLQILALQNNDLGMEGGEPCSLDVLGQMDQLQQLSIRNNRFTGATIPASFGQLINLDRFYIDHMGLVGEIPLELEAVVIRTKEGEDCCMQLNRVPAVIGTAGECFATQLLNFPAVAGDTCQLEQGTGNPREDPQVLDRDGEPYGQNTFNEPLPFFLCDTRRIEEVDGVWVLTDDPDGIPLGCDGAGGIFETTNLGEYPFVAAADYSLPDCDEPAGYETYQFVPDGPNEDVVINIEKGKNKCKVDRTVLNWCINSDLTLPRSSPFSTNENGHIGGQNPCRNFN